LVCATTAPSNRPPRPTPFPHDSEFQLVRCFHVRLAPISPFSFAIALLLMPTFAPPPPFWHATLWFFPCFGNRTHPSFATVGRETSTPLLIFPPPPQMLPTQNKPFFRASPLFFPGKPPPFGSLGKGLHFTPFVPFVPYLPRRSSLPKCLEYRPFPDTTNLTMESCTPHLFFQRHVRFPGSFTAVLITPLYPSWSFDFSLCFLSLFLFVLSLHLLVYPFFFRGLSFFCSRMTVVTFQFILDFSVVAGPILLADLSLFLLAPPSPNPVPGPLPRAFPKKALLPVYHRAMKRQY